MASGDLVDEASSTQVTVIESVAGIPDDIFHAAWAASKYDSDGEDPFEPQPKRFMQTKHQKREQKRDLEIKRLAWTIRKMRKQFSRQKQPHSPFEMMPSDLVLKLMQHTHLADLHSLRNSSAINRSIFKANEKAVYRGMEIEQFPEWTWLFGDSKQRTPAQSQNLKDAIVSNGVSEGQFYNLREYGSIDEEDCPLRIVRKVDNNEFSGVRNIKFLRLMQSRLDVDIKLTETYTGLKIARRTAICLRSLGFHRLGIADEELRYGYGPAIEIPWEARSQRIREQPASIQAEIRSVLKSVVGMIYRRIHETVQGCLSRSYHRNPGNHGNPEEAKKWASKLVTGRILEVVIPEWRTCINCPPPSCFVWDFTCLRLYNEIFESFERHDEGTVDVMQEVEHGLEFGRSIGLDLERLLGGIVA